ncbi:MAG: DUF1934 domain-containing protein [Clostridia bacterium]|nr:DUF1934 domain-containing protein [Clostridia bacterium]
MKNNAFISIKGTQTTDGDKNVVEYKTDGEFEIKNNVYFLSYLEPDDQGGDIKTVIRVADDSVAIRREGITGQTMMLRKGERHHCQYVTAFGEMLLGVNTHSLKYKMSQDGGHISVKYDLEFNSSLLSENSLSISVKCRE